MNHQRQLEKIFNRMKDVYSFSFKPSVLFYHEDGKLAYARLADGRDVLMAIFDSSHSWQEVY